MAVTDLPVSSRSSAPAHPAAQETPQQAYTPLLVKIYCIALFIPATFQLGPLAMTPLRLFLLCVTPVLFVQLLGKRFGVLRQSDFLIPLYLIWATLCLGVNNPDQVVQNAGVTWIEFFGSYLMARAYIRDRQSFIGFCRYFTAIVALTLIPVLIEQATGRAILMMAVDAIPGLQSSGDGSNTRLGLERVQVAFPHPILYGLVCSIAIPLTLVSLKNELSPSGRLLRGAIVSICTFFSLSSGALLAMVLHFFLIGWSWLLKTIKARWKILLCLIITTYLAIDLLSNRTPIRVFLSYATFSTETAYTRLRIFDWGMVNVQDNPIFGIGLNDWVRPPNLGKSVDNFWLLTAMRYGVPGFIFLATSYLTLLWQVGRKDFNSDAQMMLYRRGWCFALAGLVFTLTTVHIWAGAYSLLAFLLAAGIWFLEARPNEGLPESGTTTSPPPSERSTRYRRSPEAPSSNRASADPDPAGQNPSGRRRSSAKRSSAQDSPERTPPASRYTRMPPRHKRKGAP